MFTGFLLECLTFKAGGKRIQLWLKTIQQLFSQLPDLPASLLSLSSPTPLSPRSPAPMPPPSLSLSFSPCRREQVRLRRRRAGGVLAASAPTASPVVTTNQSPDCGRKRSSRWKQLDWLRPFITERARCDWLDWWINNCNQRGNDKHIKRSDSNEQVEITRGMIRSNHWAVHSA